jgi:hypothetical protein
MKIINNLKKYISLRLLLGIILGGLAGFLYYYFVGCASGGCPITSNPYLTIGYGILLGLVLFIKKKDEKQ